MRNKIRYAVVGLGDIAQGAVLPAFANAGKNSELVALVSDDRAKLKELSKKYGVLNTVRYRDYEPLLASGRVDAVYLALPNAMHCEYALRAAYHRVHVLCEKPLAVTEDECHEIIRACAQSGVKLMTAYRLHFERGNLEAIRAISSGKIGEPRIFNSLFTQQVRPGDIRLDRSLGGGSLYDVGVYCINAARYLFRDEPTEVFAYSAKNGDARFKHVDEMTTAVLQFPKNRLATFTTSFGAADAATYTVMGTKGSLTMDPAYEYSGPLKMEIAVDGRSQHRTFPVSDQFAPELLYFSDCILKDREPEPGGIEGLIDVHIVRSLYQSAASGLAVRIKELRSERRPDMRQKIHRPQARHPAKIHAKSPTI